jgi:uncharacterized protein
MYTFLRVAHAERYIALGVATKIGQLAQELARTNPWWRDPAWRDRDSDLRQATADGLSYRSSVLDELRPGCLYLLRGPRRVGKTVAVKQQIEDLLARGVPPTCIVRVAADAWDAKDLRTLLQNTALPPTPVGAHRYWFLDEVSAVTGPWDQQLKWLRDNDIDFRAATVVLTGSNATSLTEAAGTLAGRRGRATNLDRILLPIGFRTFVRLVGREPTPTTKQLDVAALRTTSSQRTYAALLPWLDSLVALWELYLAYGGFPRAVAAAVNGEPIPSAFVEDLFNVVSADAFKSSRLSALTEMALLERLWTSMASPANLSNIGKGVGVSHEVVGRHVAYLRDAFLLWHCPQRNDQSWLPRERAQDKLYAVDPLVARLAHLRNPARSDIDPTVLTEMQIGMSLRRRVLAGRPAAGNDQFLFYARTPTRKEIDFVAEDLAGVAIEAKYCEDGNWHADAATVNASQWDGILATRNVLDTTSDGAWAVPAAVLCYLLDT